MTFECWRRIICHISSVWHSERTGRYDEPSYVSENIRYYTYKVRFSTVGLRFLPVVSSEQQTLGTTKSYHTTFLIIDRTFRSLGLWLGLRQWSIQWTTGPWGQKRRWFTPIWCIRYSNLKVFIFFIYTSPVDYIWGGSSVIRRRELYQWFSYSLSWDVIMDLIIYELNLNFLISPVVLWIT